MKLTYAIAYQIVTPESAVMGDYAEEGYEIEETEESLSNIIRRAVEKYGITYRRGHDATAWWESIDPVRDFETGNETFYSLHISINGSWITRRQVNRINQCVRSRWER